MKKLIASVLATLMLAGTALSAVAEDNTGLTLAEGSHLVLGETYIDKIDGTVTVGELKSNFAGTVDVAGKTDDKPVCTDDVVSAGEESLKALIYGDVNRDGKVSIPDVTEILKHIAKWDPDINADAADVDKNEKINVNDVTKMLKKIAKWGDISLGNVRMVFENTAVTKQNDGFDVFFTSMMNKLADHETDHTGEYAYRMKLARNETESCQALMLSDTAREGLTAEITAFEHEYGEGTLQGKLEFVKYYETELLINHDHKLYGDNERYGGNFPEVLLPMAESFEVKADTVQHIVISVTSDKETPAGMYKAQLHVKDSEGNILETSNVYAYVWDFTLPDTPYSASLFNTGKYLYKDKETGKTVSDYERHFEFMLQNNLSSYVLPYPAHTDEATKYLDDPRMTCFVLDGADYLYGGLMDYSDWQVKEGWKKLQTNPDWMKKHVFYFTDEPGAEQWDIIVDTYEYNAKLIGTDDFRNMTQVGSFFLNDEDRNNNIDSLERMKPYINTWCVYIGAHWRVKDGGGWMPRYVYSKWGDWEERKLPLIERGDEIWWYVLETSPYNQLPNFFVYQQGVVNRELLWQQYDYEVNTLLYYATGMGWNTISKYQFDIGTGDGTLNYPGELFGFDGPIPSWRLYQIRDGFDDFDYLSIAEELTDRETVEKIVHEFTPNIQTYTEDYRDLENARDEIAQLILDNQK